MVRLGGPDGSPERDWYEAERMLNGSAEDMTVSEQIETAKVSP